MTNTISSPEGVKALIERGKRVTAFDAQNGTDKQWSDLLAFAIDADIVLTQLIQTMEDHVAFVEQFGRDWLDGSVSAKTVLLGYLASRLATSQREGDEITEAEARGYAEAVAEIADMARRSRLVHPVFVPAIEGLTTTRDANKAARLALSSNGGGKA